MLQKGRIPYTLPLLEDPEGPLLQCKAELEILRTKLKVLEVPEKGRQKVVKCLTWPFRRQDIEKSGNLVEKCTGKLVLIFGVENMQVFFTTFNLPLPLSGIAITLGLANSKRSVTNLY